MLQNRTLSLTLQLYIIVINIHTPKFLIPAKTFHSDVVILQNALLLDVKNYDLSDLLSLYLLLNKHKRKLFQKLIILMPLFQL